MGNGFLGALPHARGRLAEAGAERGPGAGKSEWRGLFDHQHVTQPHAAEHSTASRDFGLQQAVCDDECVNRPNLTTLLSNRSVSWGTVLASNIVWVADALSNGIDGILLLGCKYGDDYQCHFIKGSELANTRMGNVQDTLDRLMLESDRLRLEQIAITDYEKLPKIFDDFLEKLEELGPNPYKE